MKKYFHITDVILSVVIATEFTLYLVHSINSLHNFSTPILCLAFGSGIFRLFEKTQVLSLCLEISLGLLFASLVINFLTPKLIKQPYKVEEFKLHRNNSMEINVYAEEGKFNVKVDNYPKYKGMPFKLYKGCFGVAFGKHLTKP